METRFLTKEFKMKPTIKAQYEQEQEELLKKKGSSDEFDITTKKKKEHTAPNNTKKDESEDDNAEKVDKDNEIEGGADAGANL